MKHFQGIVAGHILLFWTNLCVLVPNLLWFIFYWFWSISVTQILKIIAPCIMIPMKN